MSFGKGLNLLNYQFQTITISISSKYFHFINFVETFPMNGRSEGKKSKEIHFILSREAFRCHLLEYSAIVYYTRLEEFLIFQPWIYTETPCAFDIYLPTIKLFICITSNSDKHGFSTSNIRVWISCNNDVMNDVDSVIKRDGYPQKNRSCSKDISGFFSYAPEI